jgi:hypothetical protein
VGDTHPASSHELGRYGFGMGKISNAVS